MTFEYSVIVRGYEIDSFGHLNNAVYLNYMEHARWDIIKKMELFNYLNETKNLLVVTEANIRYVREAKIFDELVIKTELFKEAPYLVFLHKIYNVKTELKICQAKINTLLIDSDRLPVDLPKDFESRLAGGK